MLHSYLPEQGDDGEALPLLSNDPISLEAVPTNAAIRWDTPLMIDSRVALYKDTLVVPGRVGGTAAGCVLHAGTLGCFGKGSAHNRQLNMCLTWA